MKRIVMIVIALCYCASLVSAQETAQEPDKAVHDELRSLLKVTREAVNSGDYDKMLPALSEDVRLTTSTQDFLGSNKDVVEYMGNTFGEGKKMTSVKLEWEPEVLTELSPDKSWGLAYGTGVEDYVHSDGRTYHFLTRWTAVVAKEADGKWRIRGMHMGANFLDNPILDEVAVDAKKYAMLSGGGGLLLGLLLGFLVGRRKS
jgi:ketosteroid isomerase-like protein